MPSIHKSSVTNTYKRTFSTYYCEHIALIFFSIIVAMYIKTYCLFVIGVVVALNHQVDANYPARVPQVVVVQLHYVVRLLKNWVDHNRDIHSKEFKKHFAQLGAHVSHILSLTRPEYSDFCLWQLNILANQIHTYYQIRYKYDMRSRGLVINWINDQVCKFLQMIEGQLKSIIDFYESVAIPDLTLDLDQSHILATVIPVELSILGECIVENMVTDDTIGIDTDYYHPRNLYLNHIVSSKSSLALMSESYLIKWDTQYFRKLLVDKYVRAIYESGDINCVYSELMSLRYLVFVKMILVSLAGHLDVHLNAYRLHALQLVNTGRDDVWNSVMGLLKGFIDFFQPEYNSHVISVVYKNLIEAERLDNPLIMSSVCQVQSELLQSLFRNQFPAEFSSSLASSSSGPRTTKNVLMDMVGVVYPNEYHDHFMSIAVENYEQLNKYLTTLYFLFKNVNFRKWVHFLNINM